MGRFIIAGILIITLLGWPAAVFGASPAALAAQELALASNGGAYEIEPDSQGRLWITEYNLGELWRLDPTTNTFEVYAVGGSPEDAHPDTKGSVWWLEDLSIHTMDIASRSQQSWNVINSVWMWGLSVDSLNNIWISDYGAGNVLHFDPVSQELKTYSLPNGGIGNYITSAGPRAWLGDSVNERLLRLDAATDQIEWWKLPAGSSPYDVAVDAAGNVWYTDRNLDQIGKLDPIENLLTVYILPSGSQVKMLAAARQKLWFTEEQGSPASFGSLDPQVATGNSQKVNNGSDKVTPWIDTLSSTTPASSTVDVRTETPALTPSDVTATGATGGWAFYQLPSGASPWGVAVSGYGWVVDQGRKVLVRFSASSLNPGDHQIFIPAVAR